jgi:hypothetical protein
MMTKLRANGFAASRGAPRAPFPRQERFEDFAVFVIDDDRRKIPNDGMTIQRAASITMKALRSGDNPLLSIGCAAFHDSSVSLTGGQREILGIMLARGQLGGFYKMAVNAMDAATPESLPQVFEEMVGWIGSIRLYASSERSMRLIQKMVDSRAEALRRRYGL